MHMSTLTMALCYRFQYFDMPRMGAALRIVLAELPDAGRDKACTHHPYTKNRMRTRLVHWLHRLGRSHASSPVVRGRVPATR
jgi:hypothetical protein